MQPVCTPWNGFEQRGQYGHGIYGVFITTGALEEWLRSAAAAQATQHTLLSNLPGTDTNQIKGD